MVTTNGGFLFSRSRSFLLDEIFASHLFLLGHRNYCTEQRLKAGDREMGTAVWTARINGNLKSHSGCPTALGIRLTDSVDKE